MWTVTVHGELPLVEFISVVRFISSRGRGKLDFAMTFNQRQEPKHPGQVPRHPRSNRGCQINISLEQDDQNRSSGSRKQACFLRTSPKHLPWLASIAKIARSWRWNGKRDIMEVEELISVLLCCVVQSMIEYAIDSCYSVRPLVPSHPIGTRGCHGNQRASYPCMLTGQDPDFCQGLFVKSMDQPGRPSNKPFCWEPPPDAEFETRPALSLRLPTLSSRWAASLDLFLLTPC